MTLLELKKIADNEMARDGALSKGVRIDIIEKAREGWVFEVRGTHYDVTRIASALRKTKDNQRMETETLISGKTIKMSFNKRK